MNATDEGVQVSTSVGLGISLGDVSSLMKAHLTPPPTTLHPTPPPVVTTVQHTWVHMSTLSPLLYAVDRTMTFTFLKFNQKVLNSQLEDTQKSNGSTLSPIPK